MGDIVSEFEEFLNWRKGRESTQRQEGLLGEIRDSLKALGDRLGPAPGGDSDGEDTGDGTPPAPPPKPPTPAATGGTGGPGGGKQSRWFGEQATGS